ncbi:MAG: hypothetical protein RJA23_168 [Bacteroidota bacterium]
MALILGREILLKYTSLRLPKGGTEGRQARAVSIVFHEAARRGGYFHRISMVFQLKKQSPVSLRGFFFISSRCKSPSQLLCWSSPIRCRTKTPPLQRCWIAECLLLRQKWRCEDLR